MKKNKILSQPVGHFSATNMLHLDYKPEWSEGMATVPIFTSSTAVFSSPEAGAKAFQIALDGKDGGELIYSRLNHPTAEILENRFFAIEPGSGKALVFASGMSAIVTTVFSLLSQDKTLIFSSTLYGGTHCFFMDFLKTKLGYRVVPVDTSNLKATEQAIRRAGRNLGMVFLETPANPTMAMTGLDTVANLAQKANPRCVVVVDNTFMGIFQQPFMVSPRIGLVIYSATKFLGGHSNLIGGAVVARSGREELIRQIKTARTLFGTIMSPFTAWQVINHLATYKIRMQAQAQNAELVAKYLSCQSGVEKVIHPSLLVYQDCDYKVYRSQCSGPGSIIAFYLRKKSRVAAYKFLQAVKDSGVILLAVSLGGVESLIEHPASMTHSEMSKRTQIKDGITDNLIRLSVGLEDPDDIIAALKAGFKAIGAKK